MGVNKGNHRWGHFSVAGNSTKIGGLDDQLGVYLMSKSMSKIMPFDMVNTAMSRSSNCEILGF